MRFNGKPDFESRYSCTAFFDNSYTTKYRKVRMPFKLMEWLKEHNKQPKYINVYWKPTGEYMGRIYP